MPDHNNGDKLSRAKDEIIAYLSDGRTPREIYYTLSNKNPGALYDYYNRS
jgi:hypothetical protein